MHTLSHFQAKKQLYIHTYTLYTSREREREREEKCGIFQRNKRKESFVVSLSQDLLVLVCIWKQKKETVVSWWQLWFLFFIEGSNLIWGKRPTRETCLSVCCPFNLSSVLFFFVMCKEFVLRIWSLSLNQNKTRFHEMGLSLILLVSWFIL